MHLIDLNKILIDHQIPLPMKTLSIISFVFTVLISINSCKQTQKETNSIAEALVSPIKNKVQKETLKLLWKTEAILKTPESALYDSENSVIYVSNVNQNPWNKDNNGSISKVNLDGKVLEVDWITGISGPKGLGLHNGILYASDIDEVIAVNTQTGKIIKHYPIQGATKLNDVAVGPNGRIYITDMGTGKIHYIENEKTYTWKEGLNKPNGILIEKDRILTASAADGSFIAHDIKTKEATLINNDMKSGDGIENIGPNEYLVSNWGGEIYKISENKSELLLSTKEEKKQTADIGIIKEKRIVLVPTFFDNRLVAYKY